MGGMALGDDGAHRARHLVHGSVGETLLVAVIFAVAMGFTWVNQGGDDSVQLAVPSAQAGESASTTIPPSQPAVAVSFSRTGAIIRPAPSTARIVDPDTGEDVVVPLPPGSTVVDGEVVPIGTGTTRPGSTGTTGPGSGTTRPTTTTTGPTTSTTGPTTTATTTTTTTEPTTTTTDPTTTTTEAEGLGGGLLGGVVDLLGG
jgi:hypothetical protein